MPKSLSLYELNSLVSSIIAIDLPDEYWVEAEISETREVRGHCYMELVEKDELSNTPIARASAKCWASRWSMLRPMFERVTGQRLHAGMKVMLRVKAQFHAAYGFSWIVSDINPEYTMGDLMRRRQEIIRQLKAEGVFDLQKSLHLSPFAQNIAVVSSDGAAGYGDFCHQLIDNQYGYAFYMELFTATMQGEQVEQSIIDALNRIYDRQEEFDAVVIIRGGGATSDLSGFDTLALAENVANFPLPVITGIGHDRDESVLDMVSNTRVKTPTAAAAFLVDNLAGLWSHIDAMRERVATTVRRRMETERQRLGRISGRVPLLFSLVKERQQAKLTRLMTDISGTIRERLQRAMHEIDVIDNNIAPLVERKLTLEGNRVDRLALRAEALDPQLLLKRGYSITLFNGKAVHDPATLKEGDVIETRVEKGSIVSTIHLDKQKP